MAAPTRIGDEVLINLNGKILPSEVSKNISGLAAKYAPDSSDEGWYYKLTNVTTSNGHLLSEEPYLSKGANTRGTDIGSNASVVSLSDKVKFLIVIHTGWIQDGTTRSTESVYLTVSGSTAAHNGSDSIEIGYKEAWYAKMNNATVADIFAITGTASGGGTGSGKVQCLVAAILEDV